MRDQSLAQKLARHLADLFDRFDDLDAARLAASASMNLRLDHMHQTTMIGGSSDGFVNREGCCAARHSDAEAGQQALGLMFMDIHVTPHWRGAARALLYSRDSTTSFNARTAATEWSNIAFSSSFSAISTTRSTPPAPRTTGTPT